MNGWPAWIVAFSVLVTAVGLLWRQVVKPIIRLVRNVNTAIPVLSDLTGTFKDSPGTFQVLDEIAAQFRTDAGSSLRDVVNRIEVAAKEAAEVVDRLRVNAQSDRQLAERDRVELQNVLRNMEGLATVLQTVVESGRRTEAGDAQVAEDLAGSQARADEAEGPAGHAADEASRTPEDT